MAKEIMVTYGNPDKLCYVVIWDMNGKVYSDYTEEFVTYDSGDWANYVLPMTETRPFRYLDMLAFDSGIYFYQVNTTPDGYPDGDFTDAALEYKKVYWDGTNLMSYDDYVANNVSLDLVIEGTYTMQDILKIIFSVLAGKSSGGGTETIIFRDLADSLDRVEATVDSGGNRTNVDLDV